MQGLFVGLADTQAAGINGQNGQIFAGSTSKGDRLYGPTTAPAYYYISWAHSIGPYGSFRII